MNHNIPVVCGIDICCDHIVACFLTEYPDSVRDFFNSYEFDSFDLNWDGFHELMSHQPSIVIYEPTGLAYSTVWVTRLREAGVVCKGVDHATLHAYRKGLGLPDKDDFADSLALACYGVDDKKRDRFSFIRPQVPLASELRRLSLRLNHIDRRKSPIINRLKQDLSIAFPEQASKGCNDAPLFWGWLAGERKSVKYDLQARESIGLGIRPETILQARAFTSCLREEAEIEQQLVDLYHDTPELLPYRKVLSRFGFGDRTGALLASYIYPFEDFLKDGEPEQVVRKGKVSGKRTTRHMSLRRFQKVLGAAPSRFESGNVKKQRRAGSTLARKALWQWCYTRVEPLKKKCSNPLILEFRDIWREQIVQVQRRDLTSVLTADQLKKGDKQSGVRLKLARAYLRRKVTIRLFADLVQEFCK